MDNIKEGKENNVKVRFSSSFKDLVMIIVIFILVLILSYFFDVFIFIIKYLERYPGKIIYVDEIIIGLLTLSISFAIFSWRRWLELKKETAARIALQEELVRLADTKAETERIISMQLRSEIELRKETGTPPKARGKVK